MEEINWGEIAGEILERVCVSLDYYCHRVSGDTLEDCYAAHYGLPLYVVAETLIGLGFEGVTERDLELLREMPEEIYKEIEAELNRRIEIVLDNLIKWEE